MENRLNINIYKFIASMASINVQIIDENLK